MSNDFRQEYVKLKKQYEQTEENSDSILAFYTFVEILEANSSLEAKQVLVDVYDLLYLKKSAYELFVSIMDHKDKRVLKRLGVLKEYLRSYGDNFAVPKPKTAEEKNVMQKKLPTLPFFRYHPNPLDTGAFTEVSIPVICDCCKKETNIYYESPFYAVQDIDYLCPMCIASGDAAKKLDGSYQDDYSADKVSDSKKLDELIHRTPGYHG